MDLSGFRVRGAGEGIYVLKRDIIGVHLGWLVLELKLSVFRVFVFRDVFRDRLRLNTINTKTPVITALKTPLSL